MSKLTEADRLAITKRLAAMDRDMLIGVREVAVLFNTTVASIQQACSTMRIARGGVNLRLPRRIEGIGRRVAWLHGEVRDALAASQVPQPPAVPQTATPTDPGTESDGAKTESAPSESGMPKKARMGRKRKA